MKTSYLSKNFIISVMAASATLLTAESMASGYAIRESSTSLLGNSYAGSSTSDEDVTSMHYNPATLAMTEKNAIYLSGTGIFPDIDAHNISSEAFFTPDPFAVSGSNSASDIGKDAFIPAGYFAWDVDEDWKLGLAITSPWGLSTGYGNDWAGRYHGVDTTLESVNINPILSVSVNEHLSLAAGFQAQYINTSLKQYNYQFFEIPLPPPPIPGYLNTAVKVAGNDWAAGYNLGILYEFTKHTRFGVGYQSKISHTINGDASLDTNVSGLPFDVPVTSENDSASTQITTPEQVNFGLSHDINKHWSVMGDMQWTRWSRFKELDIEILTSNGEVHPVTPEFWKNTWFYALGADYKPNQKWVFRGGVAYDQSPVDDKYRNPTIPDSDRVLLSAGLGYNFTDRVRLDAGYMYVFFKDTEVNLPLEEDSPSLNADYEGNANIVSVGLNWLF